MKSRHVLSAAVIAAQTAAFAAPALAQNMRMERAPMARQNPSAHPGFNEILSRINSHVIPALEKARRDPKYAGAPAQNELSAALNKVQACIEETQAAQRTATASEPAIDAHQAMQTGLSLEKSNPPADFHADLPLRAAQDEIMNVTGMFFQVRKFFDMRLAEQHATRVDESMQHIVAAMERLNEAYKATGAAAHPGAMLRVPGNTMMRQ